MSNVRPKPMRGGASRWAYDAFLSYSHAADGRLAPALQRGLQRLTRAWYQRQALRVFRDQASLAANPDLWQTIQRALRESRYFVLMASPEAAGSEWVGQEVGFWQDHRERETFLIVLTGGTIRWDDKAGDFDWSRTDALPRRLSGWFPREPLWVDLSWTRPVPTGELSLRHARFRDNVGTLAAAIHGLPKDRIDGEDARQHRRATMLGRSIVAVLASLVLLTGIAARNADAQRAVAEQQRTVAEQQRDLATGRELEAEAQNLAGTAPQASLQDSLAALRVDPTAQVRNTLVSTLTQTNYDGSSPQEAPSAMADAGAFSTGGRLLAQVPLQTDNVRLWNTADPVRPVRVATLRGSGLVNNVSFGQDGRVLAVANDDSVRLWNVAGAPRPIGALPVRHAQDAAFAPDGTTVAVVGQPPASANPPLSAMTLSIWDIADPAHPVRLVYRNDVYDSQFAEFSPDGRLLVTASGSVTFNNQAQVVTHTGASLWDVSNLSDPRRLARLNLFGEGIAFSPDGRTLALGYSNAATLWNIADPARPARLTTLAANTNQVQAIAFGQDGRTLATADLSGKVVLWNTTAPAHTTEVTSLAGDPQGIDAATFSGGGATLLTADSDTQVFRWRAATDPLSLAATLDDQRGPVQAVAVSPDSRIVATANYDGSVTLWDVTDPDRPSVVARLTTGTGKPVSAVAFSQGGSVLAAGGWGGRLVLWNVDDTSSPRLLASVPCRGEASWVDFGPGGRFVVAGGDTMVQGFPQGFSPGWVTLWSLGDPARPALLDQFGNVGGTYTGGLSPDGKVLAFSAGSAGTQVWNVSDPAHPVALRDPGNPLSSLSVSTDFGDDIAFSQDGRHVATIGGSYSVVLWGYRAPDTATPLAVLSGPSGQVNGIAFHPGGNLVAAASDDLSTTIWDIADPAQPFAVDVLHGHTDVVNDVAFSPDGRLLVNASGDGTAMVWSLGSMPAIAANPVAAACGITGGGFTRSQWVQNVPGIPYQDSCP